MKRIQELNSHESLGLHGLANKAMCAAVKMHLKKTYDYGWVLVIYIHPKDTKLFTKNIHNRIVKKLRDYYNEIVLIDYKFVSKKRK